MLKRAFAFGGLIVFVLALLYFVLRPTPKSITVSDAHKKWHMEMTDKIDCMYKEVYEHYAEASSLKTKAGNLKRIITGFNTNAGQEKINFIENEVEKLKLDLISKGSSNEFCK